MQKAIFRYILNLLFLLLLIVLGGNSYSQFTPARGTFVVTPPYPNKLSDYGNPNLLKMNATITATDPSFTSKAIRLKLSIFYNQQLLMQGNDMVVGDTFTYSNWCKISVKSVEKVGGYYKGKGVYRMPLAMFGFPLINIIFDSITVNTDLVALSGGFEAVTKGMAGVADVDEAVNVGRDLVSNVQGIVQDVKQLVEDVKQELNALLETLQAGKNPTVEELESAKKGMDNLVVEGKKTLEELKKNPEENKEQIDKMEEAITKLESCSKCVDDHAKANKEEEQKKKEESTAKAGPNRYEIYNAYTIAADECQLENEIRENGIKRAADIENITIELELGKVWEFFKKCSDGYKNQKEGFVPRCVWDHNNYVPNGIFVPYYSDPALVAGIVDGLLETGEGVFNIVKFVDCYSLVSPRAWFDKDCEYTRAQTLTVLKSLVSIFSSAEQFKQVAGEICKSVGKYCDQTAGVDNQARYNQGKAIFNVATLFIGVGEIKAILNGEKTLLEVVNASATAYVKSMTNTAKGLGNLLDKNLISELRALGTKFDETKLIGLIKNNEGKIIWLDKGLTTVEAEVMGKKPAGFAHIIEEHERNFLDKGISKTELSEFLLKTVKENKIVGQDGTRFVYESIHNGTKQTTAITIGSNGYVVGANPYY